MMLKSVTMNTSSHSVFLKILEILREAFSLPSSSGAWGQFENSTKAKGIRPEFKV